MEIKKREKGGVSKSTVALQVGHNSSQILDEDESELYGDNAARKGAVKSASKRRVIDANLTKSQVEEDTRGVTPNGNK